jgi:hypothetical protein
VLRTSWNAAAGISSIEQVTRLSVLNTSADSRSARRHLQLTVAGDRTTIMTTVT